MLIIFDFLLLIKLLGLAFLLLPTAERKEAILCPFKVGLAPSHKNILFASLEDVMKNALFNLTNSFRSQDI